MANEIFPQNDERRHDDVPRQALMATTRRSHPSRREAIADQRGDVAPAISLGYILGAVGQWWKLALPAGLLLSCVAGAVIWFLFEPLYRATASLQINDQAPFIAFPSRDDSRRYIDTQVELIRSPLVLGSAISRPEVAALPIVGQDEPIKWLAERLVVAASRRSDLFDVSFSASDPSEAAILANAIVDAYFQVREERDTASNQQVIQLLEVEQARRGREVERLREKVRTLGRDVLGRDPFTGMTTVDAMFANQPLQALQSQLTQAEVETHLLEAQVKAQESVISSSEVDIPEAVVEMAAAESPELFGIRQLLLHKRDMMHRTLLKARHGESDPSYQRLKREVEQLEQLLDSSGQRVVPRVRRDLLAMAAQQRNNELAQARTAYNRQKLTVELLQKRYDEEASKKGGAGGGAADLESSRVELARVEQVYNMIAQRAQALRIEMHAPPRVTFMKRADVPEGPVERAPMKPLVAAMLASFALPFGLAVVRERTVRRIANSQQLERFSDLAVLAEVAELPVQRILGPGGASLSLRRDLGVFEESIDSLRTCLMLHDDRCRLRVLAVASAVPREGKTSVASQLAVSIARSSGSRTLLIDGDMRSPDIHRIFEIRNEPGLAKLLDGQCTIEEAVVTDWSESVHLLPAGDLHKSPHKLLGGGTFEALLEKLRGAYEYIIVDVPPILSASEALVLAKAADGTLVCALKGHSRETQVRLACERLLATGARPVGATLNGVPVSKYASTYGTYAYSYVKR